MSDAIIDLTENIHVHTVWFIDCKQRGFDVMGILFREGDGEWQGRYRFRYDPDDEKSVWDLGQGTMTVAGLFEAMCEVFGGCAKAAGGKLYVVPIHGDRLEALAALAKQPWVTITTSGKTVQA